MHTICTNPITFESSLSKQIGHVGISVVVEGGDGDSDGLVFVAVDFELIGVDSALRCRGGWRDGDGV